MLKRNQDKRLLIMAVLVVAVLVVVTLANIAFCRANPGGSRFVVGWAGTRAFFSDATSPYSTEAANRIQDAATWVTNPRVKETLRFNSPLYAIALYAPFALIKDFPVARGLWMTLIELCLIFIPILTFRLFRNRLPVWLIFTGFLLTVFSFHGLNPLIDGNDVVIFTVILLLFISAVDRGQDELAGILMAVLSMSLQNTILAIFFVIIWAFRKQRKTILNWFAGTMVLLIGFTVLLIPNWFVQALRATINLFGVMNSGSPGSILTGAWGNIGMRISVFLSVILAGILLREWIQAFNGKATFFVWGIFITLTINQWIGIPTEPGNFILLVPGILFSLAVLVQRWGAKGKPFVYAILGILLVIPWVLDLFVPGNLSTAVLFLPYPIMAILLLYWTKWWAVGAVN